MIRNEYCSCIIETGSGFTPVPERTAGGTVHNGLVSLQCDAVIESLTESAIAMAGEQVADVPKIHLLVHLCVTATSHIEIELVVGFMQNIDLQCTTRLPLLE